MSAYVYNTTTGALFSWCQDDTDPVADDAILAENGLALVTGLPPLGPTVAWDPSTKTTITVAPPLPALNIPTYLFVMMFTPAEHQAIVAAATPGSATYDQRVAQFMMALSFAPAVNLNDAEFIQPGIDYLVSLGLLTQANAALILSGQPSQ